MIDRNLRPCPGCRRHVGDEVACPFCGIALPAAPAARALAAGRFSRAAVFAGATLVGSGAGCWTNSSERETTTTVEHHDEGSAVEQHHVKDIVQPVAKGGRLEGTLTDTGSGNPVPYIQIQLVPVAGGKPLTVSTDQNGHYQFDDVTPGDYKLLWDITGNPRRSPRVMMTKIAEGAQIKLDLTVSYPPAHMQPMPYGAPPARKRIV